MYYKGLNIFVMRQLNNKIVTNFVSMSMISFLLFLSISVSLSIFTYRSNLEKTGGKSGLSRIGNRIRL